MNKSLLIKAQTKEQTYPLPYIIKNNYGGRDLSRKSENTSFVCEHCGTVVPMHKQGSFRNHCHHCLYSKHLDINPGDRLNTCYGLMKPIGIRYHKKKGYQIKHQCSSCNYITYNKTDEEYDNYDLIIYLVSNIK